MKAVRSRVLIEFDKADEKAIESVRNTLSIQSERWSGIARIFVYSDYVDGAWQFNHVAHPQMSKTKLLDDIRATRREIEALDRRLGELAEKVKGTT